MVLEEVVFMLLNIQKLLKLYRQQLGDISENHIKKVILYGSYARGDVKQDSDINIMILVDLADADMKQLENRIFDATYDFNYEYDTDIKPFVQNENHFNYWKNAYMFYNNVEKEGVIIR